MDADLQNVDNGGSTGPFRVGVLPLPGFALMSYACSVEPFRAANLLGRRELYRLVHFSAEPEATSSVGAVVPRERKIGEPATLDLLLVIAGGDPFAHDDPELFAWLRDLSDAGVQIGGVSGGSVVLARAGLMNGRRMTVHWEHAPGLASLDPDLIIEKRLYVIDRDRVTCGGGTAPIDLMHALISAHHGAVFARLVSDWFLHTEIRASGAPQRAGLAERTGLQSPRLLDAIAAMEDHVADPLTLNQLAMIAGISARQLNRLFTEHLGQSAMDYYRRLRLDVGYGLLCSTALSVGEISSATGFSSPGHFSKAFTRRYDQTPAASRRDVARQAPSFTLQGSAS